MKNLLLMVALLLLPAAVVSAQTTVETAVQFRNSTPQSKTYTLTLGVDSRATDCLDTALDEVDLPPPPPDFFPLVLPGCKDSNSGTTITLHRDYRATQPGRFSRTHDIKLYRGPDRKPVVIQWNAALDAAIDSAFLMIEFIDTVDMSAQSEFVLTNEFITDLQVRFYYSLEGVGVDDPVPAGHGAVVPNPATEWVTVSTEDVRGGTYKIFSVNGRMVEEGTIDSDETTLGISALAPGTYLLRLTGREGNSRQEVLVKR